MEGATPLLGEVPEASAAPADMLCGPQISRTIPPCEAQQKASGTLRTGNAGNAVPPGNIPCFQTLLKSSSVGPAASRTSSASSDSGTPGGYFPLGGGDSTRLGHSVFANRL